MATSPATSPVQSGHLEDRGGSILRAQGGSVLRAHFHWSGLEVRLVYYPPYHSKYNPIERSWSTLEQKWGGALLTNLRVILDYARRMVWRGQHPTVATSEGDYPDGVRLTKSQMKPIEARLQRSKNLPKYDILIRPKAAFVG